MSRIVSRAAFKNKIASKGRLQSAMARLPRLHRAVCETLEERQLMSLTMEIRAADGSSSAAVSSVGQVINLDIVAVITAGVVGANDNNISTSDPRTFGIQNVTGSVLATSPYSHAVAGGLAATVDPNFKGIAFQNGTRQDLNGDGNIDVGSNNPNSVAGYFFAHAGSQDTIGTANSTSNSIVVGELTYTVTSLNNGGETDLNFRARPSSSQSGSSGFYLVANWFDGVQYEANTGQGAFASDQVSTISAGAPFVVTDSCAGRCPDRCERHGICHSQRADLGSGFDQRPVRGSTQQEFAGDRRSADAWNRNCADRWYGALYACHRLHRT